MKKYIYIRVSTGKQDYDRQYQAFQNANIDIGDYEVIEETYTGTTTKGRVKLNKLLNNLNKGDTLLVESLSRIARKTIDTLNIIEQIENKGANIKSLKENIDTSTPMGKAFIGMISIVNQLERDMISERTREALQAKKAQGIKLGREREHDHDAIIKMYLSSPYITHQDIADKFNSTRSYISKLLKDNDITKITKRRKEQAKA